MNDRNNMRDDHPRRRPGAAVLPLSGKERRIIFREMVKAEMEAGMLRYSKRRQLLRYATKMGLPPVDAHLLIAQVQHGLEWTTGASAASPASRQRDCRPMLRKLALAGAAAVAVHLLMLSWLLG